MRFRAIRQVHPLDVELPEHVTNAVYGDLHLLCYFGRHEISEKTISLDGITPTDECYRRIPYFLPEIVYPFHPYFRPNHLLPCPGFPGTNVWYAIRPVKL